MSKIRVCATVLLLVAACSPDWTPMNATDAGGSDGSNDRISPHDAATSEVSSSVATGERSRLDAGDSSSLKPGDPSVPESERGNSLDPKPSVADAATSPDAATTPNCDEGSLRCPDPSAPQRQICNAGIWHESKPCGQDEVCSGSGAQAGSCRKLSVACSPSDCPAPANDCLTASCDSGTGMCQSAPKSAHTACATGVCDGSGKCVGCIGNEDCKNNDLCKAGACSAPPRCGDGIVTQGEQCDDGNQLNTDTCLNSCKLPSCGDGFVQATEECDPAAQDWSAWTCSTPNCRRKTSYDPCASDDDCVGRNEVCFLKTCAPPCTFTTPAGPSDCPAPPGGLQALCSFPNTARTEGLCVASGCTGSRDCSPLGASCKASSPASYCTGCQIDSDCPHGKTCLLNGPGEANSIVGHCQ